MKRKNIISIIVAAILLFSLTACSDKNSENTSTTGKKQEKEDNVLTIAIGTDMVTFDVHNHNNSSTEAIHVNIFSYLFKRDETGKPQPELVDTIQQIDDFTWEMVLKEGITFHNGDPLTSEDVKFSLERVATDKSLRDHPNYKQIKEVQVIDDRKFRVITNVPDPTLVYGLSRVGAGIMPKEYIEKNGMEYFLEHPIGTGPYKVVEWTRDNKVVLEPYENYFKGKIDEWEKVEFKVIPESSTRVGDLLTGNVDIAVDIAPNEWERIEQNENTKIITGDTTRTMILVLRLTEGTPTADPKLREAIDYAIDDKAIVDNLLGGAGTPTLTRVVPTVFGSKTDLYDNYNYDLNRAKQLVKESSYSGDELTFYSPKGRYLQDSEVAQMIVGMLNEAGIKVKLEYLEWNTFLEKRNAKQNKEMYLIAFGVSLGDAQQPLDYYLTERGKGETDYSNEEVEKLLQLTQGNMNTEERVKQLQKIQEIITEDRPHIPLYASKSVYGVNKQIEFTPNVDEVFWVSEIKKVK